MQAEGNHHQLPHRDELRRLDPDLVHGVVEGVEVTAHAIGAAIENEQISQIRRRPAAGIAAFALRGRTCRQGA